MKKNFYISVTLLILSQFILSTMAAFIKLASVSLPLEILVFFRNFFNLLLLTLYFAFIGFYQLKTQQIKLHILRGLLGTSAMYCFFYTMSHIPLGIASLLIMTTPLFIPFIAVIGLGHPLTKSILFIITLGFLGVWFILSPENITLHPGIFIGLLAGFLGAIIKVTITKLGKKDKPTAIVFYFMVVASSISFFPMLSVWTMPNIKQWLFLILIAIFAGIGQILMTKAYALTPAPLIGGFAYSIVIFSSFYGIVLWQEPISLMLIIGAGLIITAGLINFKINQ